MGSIRQTKGRSRTGCKQCRIDRKKCDEVRPSCGRCAQRRTSCDFDRPLGVRLPNRRRTSTVSGSVSGAGSMPSPRPTPTTSMPPLRSDESSMSSGSPADSQHTVHGPPHPGHSAGHPAHSSHSAGPSGHAMHSPHSATHPPHPAHSGHAAHPAHSHAHTPSHPHAPHPAHLQHAKERVSHPTSSLRDWSSPGSNAPPEPALMDVVPSVPSVSSSIDMSVSPLVVPGTSFEDLGLGQDHDPFHGLLKDLFDSTTADMTPSAMQILFAPQAPAPHRGPNVEPRDVQRRFNAPLDPRAELAGIIPAPVLATLSDTDARLFYHYIDVQATISVGVETEDNPLSTYFIPVALSAALGETAGAGAGDGGPNDGNPAFHALKACAATHRANLMDGTGTDGSAAFRQVAQSARKRAYALLAERIEVLGRASPVEREQFAGALAILVSLAVVDGNTRLLPRLLSAYALRLQAADAPGANELFFISAISLYQAWYNFNLVVILDQPLMPLLCEMARDPLVLSPGVEDVFAVPGPIALEHMRVYQVIREYRAAMQGADRVRTELAAQVDADELVTALGHAIAADLEARDREPRGESTAAKRKAIGRLLHHAALRVLLLREVFHCSRTDTTVQECVGHALSSLGSIKWGTESGLLIPLMVLATAALERERMQFRDFMVRLCWKGSVGPRAALRTLDMVIDDKALDWRDALRKVGSGLILV